MENNQLNSPKGSFAGNKGEDTKKPAQMERVFTALQKQPKTMLMVSFETGILRANICRYVAKWEKQNCIRLVQKNFCPISKHRAGFYTTNPEQFPDVSQLELF